MNKILFCFLIGFCSSTLLASDHFGGSTKSSVVIAGGIIKAQHVDMIKKYKRKDCPICKGKGYYISGDGIAKVDCGYCEPEKKGQLEYQPKSVIIHPPIKLNQNCPNNTCTNPQNR